MFSVFYLLSRKESLFTETFQYFSLSISYVLYFSLLNPDNNYWLSILYLITFLFATESRTRESLVDAHALSAVASFFVLLVSTLGFVSVQYMCIIGSLFATSALVHLYVCRISDSKRENNFVMFIFISLLLNMICPSLAIYLVAAMATRLCILAMHNELKAKKKETATFSQEPKYFRAIKKYSSLSFYESLIRTEQVSSVAICLAVSVFMPYFSIAFKVATAIFAAMQYNNLLEFRTLLI